MALSRCSRGLAPVALFGALSLAGGEAAAQQFSAPGKLLAARATVLLASLHAGSATTALGAGVDSVTGALGVRHVRSNLAFSGDLGLRGTWNYGGGLAADLRAGFGGVWCVGPRSLLGATIYYAYGVALLGGGPPQHTVGFEVPWSRVVGRALVEFYTDVGARVVEGSTSGFLAFGLRLGFAL